jgi:2-amino-4-hydroxy-6-hydroxymethyldihydropteridine diphosphokinase
VRASLADQASLAIALGANLPSPAGPPLATLLAVRPLLEALLRRWVLEQVPVGQASGRAGVRWSSLFRTTPVGGPPGQPDYLNAAVLVRPVAAAAPAAAQELLAGLQELERRFARQRRQRWGPRSLDLDLLWWGGLRCRSTYLELPHPRLLERSFVLTPLAAIDADLVPAGAHASATELVKCLQQDGPGLAPVRLTGRPGWPE